MDDYIPTTFIWSCPTCKANYRNYDDAIKCRNKHFPLQSDWYFCECGYGIRIDGRSRKNVIIEMESHKQKEVCCYYDEQK